MKKPYETAAQITSRLGRKGLESAFGGGFGLEKESLRIMEADGQISRMDHPFGDDPHFSGILRRASLKSSHPWPTAQKSSTG